MSKYSERFADGTKHYVVTIWRWGREETLTVVALDAAEARYAAIGRPTASEYVISVRRALKGEEH